jgi:hypothetical protein
MVDLDNAQYVLKRIQLLKAYNHADSKDYKWHILNDEPVGYKTSRVSSHSFVVDWQIPESEKDEKTNKFYPA